MSQHIFEFPLPPQGSPNEAGSHWINGATDQCWLAVGRDTPDQWREVVFADGNLRMKDGYMQIRHEDTGLWHSLKLKDNEDGVPTIYWTSPGEP